MNYPQIAALVLAKCAAYDPYLTEPTEETARAWAEQFEEYHLTLDDLLAGVTRIYRDNGSGYRPLPKDITDAARAVRHDRHQRSGPTAEYEALCNSKAADDEALRRITQRTGQTVGREIGEAS
jgi:hypothetical protein